MPEKLTDERLEALEAAGICLACEERPSAEDDMVCAECREYVERTSSEVVDPVEQVLNHHQHVCFLSDDERTMCRCGWSINSGPGYHRRHLAEKVYEALGLPGPAPWIDGPDVVHPQPDWGSTGITSTYLPRRRPLAER